MDSCNFRLNTLSFNLIFFHVHTYKYIVYNCFFSQNFMGIQLNNHE